VQGAAGTLEPTLTDISMERLLRRIETTFAEAARSKGLRLRIVPSSAGVRSDFILLERILINLVSNAVRFTTHGGVVVGCRRRGERLRIDVCDSGPGIPEDQRQNVFTEFYQLAAVQPDRRGGLGLGLAIVDRLGRLLDHPVELETRLGRGSRFSISVPLTAQRTEAGEAPLPLAAPIHPALGRLILVIDDDPLVIEGMNGILRSWGSRVARGFLCCATNTPSEAVASNAALRGRIYRSGRVQAAADSSCARSARCHASPAVE
jgi:two-component system, sensor histidine kinase